jgi:dolichol kinase
MAFIAAGIIVVFVTPKISGAAGEYIIGILAAIIAGIIEAASTRLRLDDNFSIPLSAGITMLLGYYFASVIDPAEYNDILRLLMQ